MHDLKNNLASANTYIVSRTDLWENSGLLQSNYFPGKNNHVDKINFDVISM